MRTQTLNISCANGSRVIIVTSTDNDPECVTTEQDERLQEHLQRAHDASVEALETIEKIAEELRFPLAFSTRVREKRRVNDPTD